MTTNDGVQDPFVTASHARTLIERRRYPEAQLRLGEALKVHPDSQELRFLSGYVDYLTDDHDEAAATLKSLLHDNPEHAGGREIYAHVLEEQKRLAEAEGMWIGLLRDYPEDPDYFAAYGMLMLRTLNVDKARRLVNEGLKLAPDHQVALFAMTMIDLIEGRRRQDSHSLATLVREHPENIRTAMALVMALHDRGDSKGALRIAQEMLRSRPDSADFVELVRGLKQHTHWSLLPMYPMTRWGWGGAVAVWIGGVVGLNLLRQSGASPTVVTTFTGIWLTYVVYTWVWPRLLKKFI